MQCHLTLKSDKTIFTSVSHLLVQGQAIQLSVGFYRLICKMGMEIILSHKSVMRINREYGSVCSVQCRRHEQHAISVTFYWVRVTVICRNIHIVPFSKSRENFQCMVQNKVLARLFRCLSSQQEGFLITCRWTDMACGPWASLPG